MSEGVQGRERTRDRLLEALFQVRPGEFPLTALLFLHSFTVVGAISVGRSLRDALVLSHHDTSSIPWLYLAQAAVVAAISTVYARFADEVRKDRMATGTGLLLAVVLVGFRALLTTGQGWVHYGLYVGIEVMAAIAIIQFWNLANEALDPREAKRLFGLIGAGGTVATIVMGSLLSSLGNRLAAEELVWLCAALMAATAALARAIGRRAVGRLLARRIGASSKGRARGGLVKVVSSGHLRLVALVGIVTFLATTLVDFQFKALAREHFDRDGLTAYFGRFYAVCGVLSLALQLVGTGRLLARFGIGVALGLLPLGLGLGSVGLAVAPLSLWASTFTKGADNVLRYTVNDATTQLLYLPVAAQTRGAAKAAIDGVLKPGAIALGGLLLLAWRWAGLGNRPLSILVVVLLCIWGVALVRLRAQYVVSLQDTLRQRRLDLASATSKLAEGATAQVLQRALRSPDAREVMAALELVPHLPGLSLDGELSRLLQHSSWEVRVAALERMSARPSNVTANDVFRLFEDPEPRVRARAIEAYCALSGDRAVRKVRGYLDDADPTLRSAAVVGMIRHGGLDGVLSAAEALKALIVHSEPPMRAQAARVLGDIGVKNFFQPLQTLMVDPSAEVQRAAIEAAGRLASPELVPVLIERLGKAETASLAVGALASFGEPVVAMLEPVLANPLESLASRRQVPRVLGQLRSPAAVRLLVAHLDAPDELLRDQVCSALRRIARHDARVSVDVKAVRRALHEELARAHAALAQAEVLKLEGPIAQGERPAASVAARSLLGAALDDKVRGIEDRVVSILALLHPEARLDVAWAGLRDAAPAEAKRLRAHAIELLDNVLAHDLKREVLPFFEERSRADRLRASAERHPQPDRSPEAALTELLADENPWVRSCTCEVVRTMRWERLVDAVRPNLDAAWPVLREAALGTLVVIDPLRREEWLGRAARDDAPLVRELGQRLAALA